VIWPTGLAPNESVTVASVGERGDHDVIMARCSLSYFCFLLALAGCTSQGLPSRPGAPDAALGGGTFPAGTTGAGGVQTTATGGPASGGTSALGSGGATGTGGLPVTVADAAPPPDAARNDGVGGTTLPVITGGAGGALSPDARVVGGSGGTVVAPPDAWTAGTDAVTGILVSSPATIDVGTVSVGTTSFAATAVITNIGATTAVRIQPSGVGLSASGCVGALPFGASCALSITVTPTVAGPIVGSVDVSATPGTGTPLRITVTGVAVPIGAFFLSPSIVTLGDIGVGEAIPIEVTVTASANLTGLVIGLQGPDLKLDPTSTCVSTLPVGTSCVIAAVFMATAAGSPVSDSIVVSQGGVVKAVPVTANVLAPAKLAVTPPSAALTATPGTVGSRLDINVGNLGGMSTGPLAVALGGPDASDFAIVEDRCSVVTLAGAKFCTITLAYKPSLNISHTETATLTITDMGPAGSTASVRLSGGPTSPPSLTIVGGPALGSVMAGSIGAEVLFTVTNNSATSTGTLTASLTSTLITISSNTCATVATLSQGETCTIGLRLAPPARTLPQAISALLTVTSANASSVAASVTGAVVSI